MANKLIKQTYCPFDNSTIKEFLCDTDADLETLPQCSPGSSAVSIESGTVKVVNTEGAWVPFADSSSGGGTGSGGNFEKKFRSVSVLEAGMPAMGVCEALGLNNGVFFTDDEIISTKTTEGVKEPSGGGSELSYIYTYYVEDEADIFAYVDLVGSGTHTFTPLSDCLAEMGMTGCTFGGAITDISQATEVGKYYALIYYVEKEA